MDDIKDADIRINRAPRNPRRSLEHHEEEDDEGDDDDYEYEYGGLNATETSLASPSNPTVGAQSGLGINQIESARKFLWDEDEDDEAYEENYRTHSNRQGRFSKMDMISGPTAAPMIVSATPRGLLLSTTNLREEIDLEGHVESIRHNEIGRERRDSGFAAGLFARRGGPSSAFSSDRLGSHGYGHNSYRRNNPVTHACCGMYNCVSGSVATCCEAIWCWRRRWGRNNLCLWLVFGVALVGGAVVTWAMMGNSKSMDSASRSESSPITQPTMESTIEPTFVTSALPASQPISEPTASAEPAVDQVEDKGDDQQPTDGGTGTDASSDQDFDSAGGESAASRLAAFESALLENSYVRPDTLHDTNSPQHRAWKWIASVDQARLSASDSFMLERYALATLFFATAGVDGWEVEGSVPKAWWKDQTNWMSSSGYCSWYGVICVKSSDDEDNENSNVLAMNLTSNGLSGHLPIEIRWLSHLDSLDLSDNQIAAHLPSELGAMASLRTLVLRNNEIAGSLPKEIGAMAKLQNLDLSYNDLVGPLPAELRGCSSLRVLILEYNHQLHGDLASLDGLTNLEILRLEKCKLEGSLSRSFYELVSLQEVRLLGNALSGPISPELSSLTSLSKLTTPISET
jgi:Leucine rich repeat